MTENIIRIDEKPEVVSLVVYPNHSLFVENGNVRIEKAESEFLLGLIKNHIKVNVAGFIDNSLNTALPGILGERDKIKVIDLGGIYNATIFEKISCYVKSIKKIISTINEKSFSYIFFPGNIAYITIIIAMILNKPFGLYIRGVWSHKLYINWLNKIVFKKAKFIFTTGLAFKDEILNYNLGVEEVVPMINLPKNIINTAISFNKTSKNLVFIGRISRVKGLYDIIEALSILNHKGFDFVLDIIGGGTEIDIAELTAFIKIKKVEYFINMHGHIADSEVLTEIVSNGWLFVFPTTYPEGFPRVVYEAMLLGIPVVTTEMPGAKGFLINEENCLITEPNNPIQLSEKIVWMLKNQDAYKAISKKAEKLIRDKFEGFKEKDHSEQVLIAIKKCLFTEISEFIVNNKGKVFK